MATLKAGDLEKISHALSDKYGVRVVCAGSRCWTDGKTIFLPSLPAVIDNHELLGMIRYYLDHEVGHIVGNTRIVDSDFDQKYTYESREIMNTLEDIRVEALMAAEWVGCGVNLSAGSDVLMAKIDASNMETKKHPMFQLLTALYTVGKHKPIPSWVSPEVVDVLNDYPQIQTIPSWASKTSDLLDLTKNLLDRYVMELAEPPEEPEEQEKKDEQEDQQEDQQDDSQRGGGGQSSNGCDPGGGPGENSPGDDGNDSQTGPDSPGDGQDHQSGDSGSGGDASESGDPEDEGCGDGEDGKGVQGVQPETPSGPHGEGDNGDGEDCGSPAPGPSGPSQPVTRQPVPMTEEEAEEASFNSSRAIGEAVVGEIAGLDAQGCNRPLFSDMDTIEDQTYSAMDAAESHEFFQKARRVGGPMSQRLSQLLQVEDKSWWRGGMTKGLPDPRRLASLAAGIDDRVMRRRFEQMSPNTACYLLVDGSTSMACQSGDPPYKSCMADAVLAAAAFGTILDMNRHANTVVVFQDGNRYGYAANMAVAMEITRGQAYELRSYGGTCGARLKAVKLTRLKRWDEPIRKAMPKIASAVNMPHGLTPMGEAILFAAKDLISRQEKRKVLMVFTDGIPNGRVEVPYACQFCERNGIEVCLIGIGIDMVKQLHHRSAVCMDINRLGSTMMDELTKALRPGHNARVRG